MLKITLIKSTNSCLKNQKATVAALGLKKSVPPKSTLTLPSPEA